MAETTCYVLQREVRPGDKPLHDTPTTPLLPPDTVLILDEDPNDPAFKFRGHSPDDILAKSGIYTLVEAEKGKPPSDYYWGVLENGRVRPTKHLHQGVARPDRDPPTGLVVPQDVVVASGISSGDKVSVQINDTEHLVTIVSVNGETDLAKVKAWPKKAQLGPDYPKKLIPLGMFSHTLRVLELMAPVGFGQCNFTLGPGGSGKTFALLEVVRAVLTLSQEMSNLKVIVVYVGDRSKDVGLYRKVKQMVPVKDRAEFYIGDETVPATNQYSMMRYALERAWELARRYDVIVVIDSLSRAVFAHSFGYADPGGGMISGGIYTASLEQVGRDVGGAGYFEATGTSLTIFSSLLYTPDRGASAVVQFARDTMDNKPDCIWTFMNNPSLRNEDLKHKGYPWMSVHERESYTREPPAWISPHFVPSELQQEMDFVKEIWRHPDEERGGEPPQSKERHRRLMQYGEEHPTPAYA